MTVPLVKQGTAKSLILNNLTGTICRSKKALWNGTGTRNVPLERFGTAVSELIEIINKSLERLPFRSTKFRITVPLPPFLKGEGGVRRNDQSKERKGK